MSSNIKIERICEYCGNQFTAQKTVTKYCSHKCNQRAYKAKKRDQKIESSNVVMASIKVKPIEVVNNKPFLSVSEVCLLIGISKQTLYNIINRGDLQIAKIGNRTIISRDNINALLNKYTLTGQQTITTDQYYTVSEIEQKYGVKYNRLNEIVNQNSIPKKLIKNHLYLSKEHIDAYFEGVAAEVENIDEWCSVDQLRLIYGQSRDAIYKLSQKYNIPKKQVGKFVYLSKQHFDRLGIIPTQSTLEL